MGIIGARTILAEGQRWVVQEVVPFAPSAENYPITFTSHQTGVVRHSMLRKPLSRVMYANLEDAFKRSYSEAPAPPSP